MTQRNTEERLTALERKAAAQFQELQASKEHLAARPDTIHDILTKLVEASASYQEALNTLIAGQQQILDILTGKPRTND